MNERVTPRSTPDPQLWRRVQEYLDDGRRNGVRATPTIFIDGLRYDGAWAATKARIALLPADAVPMAFLGAAFLCGISDPFSFYLADQAFEASAYASAAQLQLGVLAGSGVAAALGVIALAFSSAPVTDAS